MLKDYRPNQLADGREISS